MIANLIKWSLANRLFVIIGTFALIGWGVYETTRMPVDVFPDLTAPTVTILADAHGMAPVEMETLVTLPIETALNGASGVRRIRSSTSIGAAVIWVEFEWGTDILRARQIVQEKLQLARASLPPDMKPPVMAPPSSIMGEIMYISVQSDRHDRMKIRTVADWLVSRRLRAVPGVAQVIPIGGDIKQYQVLVRPDRLAAYKVSLEQVTKALRETNDNVSAGFFIKNGQEHLIYGLGRIKHIKDIESTFITMKGGQPVTVKQIAYVRIGPALKRGDGSVDGKPAVVLAIQKQPGANTIELTKKIDDVIKSLSLPKGMTINSTLFRQSDFINNAVDNVSTALLDGAILVVLIVYIFLLNGRATMITLIAIPLSLLTAILVMKIFGASINTMTLGGMAIAVGALVDDAIIDVENIVKRLRENSMLSEASRKPILNVVFNATLEIQSSIVFATIIIIIVFVPLFFLSGVEGRLLQPLGFAYIVAIAASLIVAITITPVLCAYLLPGSSAIKNENEPRLVIWLKQKYQPMLKKSLANAKTVTTGSVMLFIASMLALGFAGQAFLPDFNEGSLTIAVTTVPGTSLKQSNELGNMAEKIILAHPEAVDRKSTRLNSSHTDISRMPSSA